MFRKKLISSSNYLTKSRKKLSSQQRTKNLKKYYITHSLYNRKLNPGHKLFKYIAHDGENLYGSLTKNLSNGILALFRGVDDPTARPTSRSELYNKYPSAVALEIIKTPPSVEKDGNDGNPNRSVFIPGFIRQDAFTPCGFINFVDVSTDYFEDILSQIKVISPIDIDSGEHDKKKLPDNLVILKDRNEKINQLKKLIDQQKEGGLERDFSKDGRIIKGKHVEIVMNLTRKNNHGFYFTLEPDFRSETKAPFPHYRHHPYASFLFAVFMQQTYLQQTGKFLPLYHYSPESKILQEVAYTKEAILAIWQEIFIDFFNECNDENVQGIGGKSIAEISLDELKVYALKGLHPSNIDPFGEMPADLHYPHQVKMQLNAMLEEMRETYCKENHIEPVISRKFGR